MTQLSIVAGLPKHPEVEDLVAYHEGRLPASLESQIGRHLDACPECSSLLSDLDSFGPTADSAEQQKGRRLAETIMSEARQARRRNLVRIAASLFIVLVGTWAWNSRRPTTPSNAPPVDIVLGTRGQHREVIFSSTAQAFSLRLAGRAIEPGRRYDIVATDKNRQVAAKSIGLLSGSSGAVVVVLKAESFPGGTYRFIVKPNGFDDPAPPYSEFTLLVRRLE
jgi:hypothetical protein